MTKMELIGWLQIRVARAMIKLDMSKREGCVLFLLNWTAVVMLIFVVKGSCTEQSMG